MKIIIFFCLLIFFCFCNEKELQKKNKKDGMLNLLRDSIKYSMEYPSTESSGLYVGEGRGILLNICEYRRDMKNIYFGKSDIIEKLCSKNILPKTDFFLENNILKIDTINYANEREYVQVCYYEIIDTYDKNKVKATGSLYEIANRLELTRGSIFLSDTTDIFGSFALIMPYELKSVNRPPSYLNVVNNLYIKSLDSVFMRISGEYVNVLPPYRIIKDAEIVKKKK